MANILYANNAVGTLAAGITNVASSLTLNVGQVGLFPAPIPPQVFYVTLTDAATQTLIEIVKVTAVSGNVFSITRAQDGTTALSWNAGDVLSLRAIRLEMQGWENAAEGLFADQGVAITPSTTLGIVGTTVADNANAGAVGEYFITSGGGNNAPSNTTVNTLTKVLQPGDWDLYGTVAFSATGSVTVLNLNAGISTASAAFQTYPNAAINAGQILLASGSIQIPHSVTAPMTRINVSVPTTVYLVAQAGYTGSGGIVATGNLYARRVR